MLPINNNYNYSCIVGNGTKVNFRPWKTKDEKEFLTYVETVDKVSDNDFFNLLIKPCLETQDIHMSEADLQYLLIQIRKASMGEDFQMKYICKNEACKKINEVDIMFDDIVDYKLDKVTEFVSSDEKIKIKFGNVKNENVFREKTKNENTLEKTFIELIMRIEKITFEDKEYKGFKYDDAYNFINNLDVKYFDKLLEYYNSNRSTIHMEGEFECMSCKTKNGFIFDEVPNFLAGW